jgi:large subunit ribosomal protein L29
MKVDDLKTQTREMLLSNLLKLKEHQFKLVMQKSIGQLRQTHLLKENRRSIARIKMMLTQKCEGN